jgi:hypothetical protein
MNHNFGLTVRGVPIGHNNPTHEQRRQMTDAEYEAWRKTTPEYIEAQRRDAELNAAHERLYQYTQAHIKKVIDSGKCERCVSYGREFPGKPEVHLNYSQYFVICKECKRDMDGYDAQHAEMEAIRRKEEEIDEYWERKHREEMDDY